MPPNHAPPPLHPEIKRELKQQLLAMSPRSFEFFAGDFLVYVGLEAVIVTRYLGDGGIDASGELIAGQFRIPIGIQVKRHRHNVRRPDIDRFIGALNREFSEGLFLTTASFAPAAIIKAASSIPRVLTLNGDQVVSLMVEHQLGLRPSSFNPAHQEIDPDYFSGFEAMRNLLGNRVGEAGAEYAISSTGPAAGEAQTEQVINLRPEQDLISLKALAYALRVDPARVRRWVESGGLYPDAAQAAADRSSYYFRRDRIEQIRVQQGLATAPASGDEWKQEFLDFLKSRNMVKSYKPVMIKAIFELVDREGRVRMSDLVSTFRAYYLKQAEDGQPLEQGHSLLADPADATDLAIKQLIITNPLKRFRIKHFITYSEEDGILQIAPQLWQSLLHYEVKDALSSVEEQIKYYLARPQEK